MLWRREVLAGSHSYGSRISHTRTRSCATSKTVGQSVRRSGFRLRSQRENSRRKLFQWKSPHEKAPSGSTRTSTIGRTITLESLSKLKPAFRKDGTITAGNAPASTPGRRP